MGWFSAPKTEIKLAPEYPEAKESRQWLLDLLKGGVPDIPVKGILGMTPTEQFGQDILAQFAGAGPSTGYTAGLGELQKIISGEYDPRTSPYYKGFREQSLLEEEAAVNKLRRGQQIRGMFTSSPGIAQERKERRGWAQGRQERLGQLYEIERGKQFAAIPLLGQFGEAEEQTGLKKLQAISQFGGLPRDIETQRKAEEYVAQMLTIMFPYAQQGQIAQFLAQLKPEWATQTEKGGFWDIADLLVRVAGGSARPPASQPSGGGGWSPPAGAGPVY